MICVAISDKNTANCLALLDKVEMAEIRLDLTGSDNDSIRRIFAHKTPKIATCRFEKTSLETQLEKLSLAIKSGAQFVDIEIETPEQQRLALVQLAKENKCKVIISYHNYSQTPGLRELYQLIDKCFELGADIAKIATMVQQKEDNARLMALYSVGKPVVSLGMGELGKVSRITALMLGAEFTFASQDDGAETAPGQIPYSKMKKLADEINLVI